MDRARFHRRRPSAGSGVLKQTDWLTKDLQRTNDLHLYQINHARIGASHISFGFNVIYIFNPEPEGNQQLHPWIINLASGQTKKLTSQDKTGEWDSSVSWRPDSQEILFVRLRRSTDTITSTLMLVSASGGKPVELIGPEVGVMAGCYAPDGKRLVLLTSKGLEIAETSKMERGLISPWSSIPNAQFRAGGLVWSRSQNLISFVIFNKVAKEYELWTILLDGSHLKKIYSQDESEGRMTVTAFIHI
jgi:hypothetical protein